MSADSGESDGKSNGASDVSTSRVGGTENGEHQDEGAQNLNAKRLGFSHVFVDVTHSHTITVRLRSNCLYFVFKN